MALKFLPADLARDAEWLGRFRGEVRAARLVSHPNTDAFTGSGRCSGGIQPTVALACLAAIIGALAVVVAVSAQTQLARIVPLDKPRLC